MPDAAARQLLQAFGTLLEYPDERTPRLAGESALLAASVCPDAADLLLRFSRAAQSLPAGALEEEYTHAFELQPEGSLYVGYHLFGESYRRSLFLLGLKERYAARGLDTGPELPDHLAAILKYLAVSDDPAETDELVRAAVLPALDKLLEPSPAPGDETGEESDGENRRLYMTVLSSLREILAHSHSEPALAVAANGIS